MNELRTNLATAITAFVATNLDDIVVLILFFSQVDATFRRRHIVAGHYLGLTILVLVSLPGYFGGLIVPRELIGLLGLLPIFMGVKLLLDRDDDVAEVQTTTVNFEPASRQSVVAILGNILNPQTYKVVTVTVANGGDNIGIYVPLFASQNLLSLGVILVVFFVMAGVWCGLAFLLTRHPGMARILTRYSEKVVPFVFIGLGLMILRDGGVFGLLIRP